MTTAPTPDRTNPYGTMNVQAEFRAVVGDIPGELTSRRVDFFRKVFMPTLKSLCSRARTLEEDELAAEAWFRVGTIHYLHDAFRASIRAHRRVLQLMGPSHPPEKRLFRIAAAWREIGDALAMMGRIDEARRAYDRAVAEHPRVEVDEDPSWHLGVLRSDLTREVAELLARGHARAALRALDGKRTIEARKWRACAWGWVGDPERCLPEWRGILQTRGPFELTFSDWFFVPDSLYDDSRFWILLRELAERLKLGVFVSHDGLEMGFCPEYYVPVCDYNIARLTHDVRLVEDLLQRQPAWIEASELLAELSENSIT